MDGVAAREGAATGIPPEQILDGYASGTSMRSLVTAQDIADQIIYLASPSGRRISGQAIAVDGDTKMLA